MTRIAPVLGWVAGFVLGAHATFVAAGPERLQITADRVSHDPSVKVVTMQGNLVIDQEQTRLSGSEGTFRAETGESLWSGDIRLEEPGRIVQSERLLAQHSKRIYRFTGQVVYRKPASGLMVTADRLIYRSRTQDAEFDGNVRLTFRDRIVTAQNAMLTPRSIVLSNEVLSEQLAGPLVVPALYVAAKHMSIDPATGDTRFWGNVEVSKLDRMARGDRATFSEQTRQIQIFPSKLTTVFIDNGLTFTSKQVDYDFGTGEFSTPGLKQLNLRIQSSPQSR